MKLFAKKLTVNVYTISNVTISFRLNLSKSQQGPFFFSSENTVMIIRHFGYALLLLKRGSSGELT